VNQLRQEENGLGNPSEKSARREGCFGERSSAHIPKGLSLNGNQYKQGQRYNERGVVLEERNAKLAREGLPGKSTTAAAKIKKP